MYSSFHFTRLGRVYVSLVFWRVYWWHIRWKSALFAPMAVSVGSFQMSFEICPWCFKFAAFLFREKGPWRSSILHAPSSRLTVYSWFLPAAGLFPPSPPLGLPSTASSIVFSPWPVSLSPATSWTLVLSALESQRKGRNYQPSQHSCKSALPSSPAS